MLSPEEHPGIFTFLVGVVVIVLVAVGLATAMEKRLASSSGGLRLEREVAVLGEEAGDLRKQLELETARLAETVGPRAAEAEALQESKMETIAVLKRKEELSAARDGLQDKIERTELEFSSYRDDYRKTSREGAVGEVVGTLTLRDGRSYLDTTITKVTDVGLEIRHQHGFARIHAPDLGTSWQDRFQWNDEERRIRLKEEAMARERMSAPKSVAAAPKPKRVVVGRIRETPKPVVSVVQDPENLAALRRLFSGWQTKVARLESERDEAILNSGRQTSVPGRLETWSARAVRLRGELSKARVGFETARANLRAVSPGDPLLMAVPVESR